MSAHDKMSPLGEGLPETEEQLFQIDVLPIFEQNEVVGATGSKSDMETLLEVAVNQVFPEELAKLQAEYDKKNWEKIRELAHKLKGGSVYCGTKRMTIACQYMERYYKAGHRKLLEELYQQLITTIKETEATIKSVLTNNEHIR